MNNLEKFYVCFFEIQKMENGINCAALFYKVGSSINIFLRKKTLGYYPQVTEKRSLVS